MDFAHNHLAFYCNRFRSARAAGRHHGVCGPAEANQAEIFKIWDRGEIDSNWSPQRSQGVVAGIRACAAGFDPAR